MGDAFEPIFLLGLLGGGLLAAMGANWTLLTKSDVTVASKSRLLCVTMLGMAVFYLAIACPAIGGAKKMDYSRFALPPVRP